MPAKLHSTLTPQQRGAKTRRAKLSPERRSEIGRLAAIDRWKRLPIVPREDKDEILRHWSRELGLAMPERNSQ
jgi:hypothetical protein